MTDRKISFGFRLGTMFLDHFIMCFIIVPPLILISSLFKSNQPIETVAFYLMMLVYLNKDFVQGRSISKRILGLRIIDIQTEEPANEFKCFLRNMTIPIWPLEVFVSLFSPTRRLGDFIANTRVVIVDKEKANSILNELKKIKLSRTTLWTLVLGIIYMGVLWYLMDNIMNF